MLHPTNDGFGQRKHDPLEVIDTQRSLEHDQFIRQHVLLEIGARLECRSKCEDFLGEFPLAKLLDVPGIGTDEYDAVRDFESFSRGTAIARTRRSGIIGDGPENHRLARSAGAFEKSETGGNGPDRRLMIEDEGRAAGNMVYGISRKVGLGRGDGLGARPQVESAGNAAGDGGQNRSRPKLADEPGLYLLTLVSVGDRQRKTIWPTARYTACPDAAFGERPKDITRARVRFRMRQTFGSSAFRMAIPRFGKSVTSRRFSLVVASRLRKFA